MEEYRQITSYKHYNFVGYKISQSGIVISNKRKTERIITHGIYNNKNYVQLTYEKYKGISCAVHKLVALLFLPNEMNYKFIKFIDGNSLNFNITNLEWTDDPYENDKYGPWEPLKDYNLYEISRIGIRNLKTKRPIAIRHDIYALVGLHNSEGDIKTVSLHTLMAKQYIPNPLNLPVVNHINENKFDFNIENLEWTTHKENTIHTIKMGLPPSSGGGRCIEELDEQGKIINTFDSIKTAAKNIGCCVGTVSNHLSSNQTAIIKNRIIRFKIYEDLDDEIWKSLNTTKETLNQNYKVSNKGRVKNYKGRIMSIRTVENGYQTVHLSYKINNNDKKRCDTHEFIHRLVAFAFLDFENRNHQVDHIDQDRSNNNVENLQILSRQDHIEKDLGIPILGLSKNFEFVIFASARGAAKAMGFKSDNISYSVRNGSITFGYRWYNLNDILAKKILEDNKYVNITFKFPNPIENKQIKFNHPILDDINCSESSRINNSPLNKVPKKLTLRLVEPPLNNIADKLINNSSLNKIPKKLTLKLVDPILDNVPDKLISNSSSNKVP
jgi:hypothetical protein